MDFRSDNTASAHPSIVEAVAAANAGRASAYGADDLTARAARRVCAYFDRDAEVYFVATGTAANSIGLAAACGPTGAIVCHREAHIENDECGAPEFYSGGAKLVLVDGPRAKITPESLREAAGRHQRGVHSVAAQAVSITQCSERGVTYRPDELSALASAAHDARLTLHMDGARLANAIAFLGCAPRDAVQGVDVLSFGATKNGAMAAEAIVVFAPERLTLVERLRKRGGHLFSKHRYLAAQFLAYLDDAVWLANARRANALAQRIGAAAGRWLSDPVEANQVFVKPGKEALSALRAQGALFYDWDAAGDEARLVVSWDQDEREVDMLCEALAALRSR